MKGAELIGGRYRLEEQIAEGGMGEVWRAHDELLGRDVAVKLLRGALAADPVVSERFRREARAAASLSHPNMAGVFDYVEEEARPGIVMELVEGETLADLIARRAPMDPQDVLGIAGQVLDALSAAHAAGVVHRDVKPGNVMLDANGQAKVTDFGIARSIGESTLTETGIVLGSVHYVAPEQLHGGASVPESDLYAVGVMLYEMLTGRRPFTGDTPVAVAMSRLNRDPAPLRSHKRDLSPALEAVVTKALARDPGGRYRSATEMHAALGEAVAGESGRRDATMVLPVADAGATRAIPPSDAATTTAMSTVEPPAGQQPPATKKLRLLKSVLLVLVVGSLAIGILAFLAGRPPATVQVPKFTGLKIEDAQGRAKMRGVVLREARGPRPFSETVPVGVILRQLTDPDTPVQRGAIVMVSVSAGPRPCCTVPDLMGLSEEEAKKKLDEAGLKLGDRTTRQVGEDGVGEVVGQSPVAGSTLARGEQVDIVIGTEERRRKGKGRNGGD